MNSIHVVVSRIFRVALKIPQNNFSLFHHDDSPHTRCDVTLEVRHNLNVVNSPNPFAHTLSPPNQEVQQSLEQHGQRPIQRHVGAFQVRQLAREHQHVGALEAHLFVGGGQLRGRLTVAAAQAEIDAERQAEIN